LIQAPKSIKSTSRHQISPTKAVFPFHANFLQRFSLNLPRKLKYHLR
jgi:hypothetical protein